MPSWPSQAVAVSSTVYKTACSGWLEYLCLVFPDDQPSSSFIDVSCPFFRPELLRSPETGPLSHGTSGAAACNLSKSVQSYSQLRPMATMVRIALIIAPGCFLEASLENTEQDKAIKETPKGLMEASIWSLRCECLSQEYEP